MYQRTKRRVLSFLSLAFMATLALLCATLMPNAYSAKAELAAPTNLKADALGFLRWDEVSGATSYEWSYSTDGTEYSSGGTCEGTEADISAAITEAVKVAQTNSATSANLYLKVKATGGEETALTHTFDKYINYGYSTHDITDVYAPANDGITGNFVATSGLYTNELMTFGVTLSKFYQDNSTSKNLFYVGLLNASTDSNVSSTTNYFYRLSFEAHGWTKIMYRNVSGGATISFSKDIGGDMVANQASYFAVGAFDTYNVSDGSVAGETVYLRRTDVIDGKPVVVYASDISTASNAKTFFTTEETADRPSHLPNARNHTTGNNSTATVSDTDTNRTGTVPKDTFAFYSGTDTAIKASSGKILVASGVSAPSMTYYDNVTGQVQWNRVEGATSYEWSYAGTNVWTSTEETYIPADKVAAAIENGEDSVRFAVRAVNDNGKSQTEYLGLDLTAFYGKLTALKDISDIHADLQNPSAVLTSSTTNSNSGYAVNTFVENAFTFDSTATSIAHRFVASMLATGDGQFNGYSVTIHAQGYITLATGTPQTATNDNTYWKHPQAVAFEVGQKYIATYGVEELFDQEGNKVADRISVRISEEVDGYRKLLTIISYDNYEYDWEGVKRSTLNDEGTYTNKQINYHIVAWSGSVAYCQVSCASLVRDITYVTNGVTHSNPATYTVGETVTFADPTAVPTGYVFEGWYFDEACTEEANITAETYSDLTVYAKVTQLPTVTVLDKDGETVSVEYAQDGKYVLPALRNGVIGYEYDGGLYNADDTLTVESDIEVKEVWLNLVMEDGAAVRLSSANNYYGGMRFTINADSATVEKYALKVFGVIVPTDDITGEFDWTTVSGTELSEYSTKEGVNVYYATLTNVLYTNYNRAFSSRGYVEVTYADGETVAIWTAYSEDKNSRSVYQVACLATADDAVTDDNKAVLANYLSYTVNVVLTDGVYSVATADVDGLPTIGVRKYTVENNVLTLSEIPENLANVLAADRPYVPVTVWSADGATYERILVEVTYDATNKTATATLPTTIE